MSAELKKVLTLTVALVALSGCQPSPTHPGELLPYTALVDGVLHMVTLHESTDSLHPRLHLVNTGEDSTHVILGECEVTLLGYREPPRENAEPVWDELHLRGCPHMEAWVFLAPGEEKVLTHYRLPKAGRSENPLPDGPLHFAARVRTDETFTLRVRRADSGPSQ